MSGTAALIEIVFGNGLRVCGIEHGALVEVVWGGFLGDLVCFPTAGPQEAHFELGLGSSAIGTLVERTSRSTMLLHLPRMNEHGRPRTKNGPALAGHGAEAVRDAIAAAIMTLPEQLRRSLTWDQGTEMAQHAQLRIDTGLAI